MSLVSTAYLLFVICSFFLEYFNIIAVPIGELVVWLVLIYIGLLFVKWTFVETNKKIPYNKYKKLNNADKMRAGFGKDGVAEIRNIYLENDDSIIL